MSPFSSISTPGSSIPASRVFRCRGGTAFATTSACDARPRSWPDCCVTFASGRRRARSAFVSPRAGGRRHDTGGNAVNAAHVARPANGRRSDAAVAPAAPARPLVSVVVPAYNEAAIVEKNLRRLCEYMVSLETECRWEIVFINDGSTDGTGDLAEAFAEGMSNIRVLHHPVNFGLGQAIKSAFNACRGDYIVTVDLDLSYSPEHIRELLAKIQATKAKIVVTSPYMKGGRISAVPWHRRAFSV